MRHLYIKFKFIKKYLFNKIYMYKCLLNIFLAFSNVTRTEVVNNGSYKPFADRLAHISNFLDIMRNGNSVIKGEV